MKKTLVRLVAGPMMGAGIAAGALGLAAAANADDPVKAHRICTRRTPGRHSLTRTMSASRIGWRIPEPG
jgi:hypothetical protein